MAAARERLPNSNTSSLATKQPLPHNTQAPTGSNDTIQQKARTAFYFNWRTTPLSLAILSTRPIRVRPTQSEHSGQRIDACERLSPPRSNSSQDDENHPISGRSPPRKGHPREKMPLSPANAAADTSPSQGHRGIALRVQSLGAFLQLRPQPTKKRRSPDQPALSFLSFANAFLALFAQGSSRTTSGAVRTCERLFGKAPSTLVRKLISLGKVAHARGRLPAPAAHLSLGGYRRA